MSRYRTPAGIAPRRSVISLQILTQLGLEHGLSVEQCLAGTGLGPLQLADPLCEIDASQELALIANLVEALPDRPSLGLEAGLRYPLTRYGIWGYALLSSPTFRAAVDMGLRYLDLSFAFVRVALRIAGERACLELDDADLPAELRDFIVQRDSAAILLIQRELTGAPLPLESLELRLPAPADAAAFDRAMGVRPTFGCAHNRIGFRTALLDLALPRGNPDTVSLCEAQCQALLARRRQRSGLAGQLRTRLLARPGRLPDMPTLAAELHLSTRTLRRRLADEGTGYRDLLEEVRQTLAEQMLASGGLTLEAIAERLGYGEPSNFLHAFKRWKGMSPSRYRQRQGWLSPARSSG